METFGFFIKSYTKWYMVARHETIKKVVSELGVTQLTVGN